MRYKKIFALLMTFIIILNIKQISYAETASASSTLDVNGKSAILMEQSTGEILFEKNSHQKLAPASITKVMTLLLIFDALESGKIKLDDMVTVSEHAASMGGSQVFLAVGEQQTVKDLIKCISIASANDAAVAMAEYTAGSEELFVDAMNKKAVSLGMNDTTFKNACGLDVAGHEMSAYDIAIMSKELITKYPQIFDYTTTWQDTIIHKTSKGESEFGLTNTNKLLKWYSYATGLKTGSTSSALYCLSGTAKKDNMQLIGVIMSAPDFKTRFHEVIKMFEYGFSNYSIIQGKPKGEQVGEVKVYKGDKDTVPAIIKDTVNILVNKDTKEITDTKINLETVVKAPINAGDKLGELIYYSNGKEVGKVELVAKEEVKKASFQTMFNKILNSCFN